jgi:cytochrome c553
MATIRFSTFALVASTALSLSLGACVEQPSQHKLVGSVTAGAASVKARACAGCHGDNMAGSQEAFHDNVTFYPDTVAYASNLTPDVATGIGSWDDAEVDVAIRVGVDGVSKPMCEPMPVYASMGDQEVTDIIAYLRSLPPVKLEVMESSCPSQHGSPHIE